MNPLTHEQTPLELTLAEIGNVSKGALDQLEHAWRRSYELTWRNPYGLTPQQVIDGLGTDAQAVFMECYIAGEYLIQHGRQIVNAIPEGVTYTANADGTITLNQ